MGPRREAEFKRKEGTVTDVVRAAPSLSSTSTSGAAGEAAVASIPLSPLDDALFIRPLVIGWSAFFKGQLEAERFKTALSLALHKFPLLAGRIRRRKGSAAGGEKTPRGCPATHEFALTNEGVEFDQYTCSAPADAFDFFGPAGKSGLAERVTSPEDNKTPPTFCPRMDATRVWEGKESLMRVRLTTLAGGSGCLVGLTVAHIAVDGASLVGFLAYWASKCQDLAAGNPSEPPIFSPGRTPPESPMYRAGPSFNRDELFQAVVSAQPRSPSDDGACGAAERPSATAAAAAAATSSSSGGAANKEKGGAEQAAVPGPIANKFPWLKAVKKTTRVVLDVYCRKQASFVLNLSADEVRLIKAAASVGLAPGEFISTNDALMAFLWTLARAAREKGEKDSTLIPGHCIMIQTINLRRYLPGLSASYFGNCSWGIPAMAPPSSSLPTLAKSVREGVSAATTPVGKTAALIAPLFPSSGGGGGDTDNGADTWNKVRTGLAPIFGDCMVTSLSYDGAFWMLDFGVGRPFGFWGGILPLAPWGFAIVQGPPSPAAAAAMTAAMAASKAAEKGAAAAAVNSACGGGAPVDPQEQQLLAQAAALMASGTLTPDMKELLAQGVAMLVAGRLTPEMKELLAQAAAMMAAGTLTNKLMEEVAEATAMMAAGTLTPEMKKQLALRLGAAGKRGGTSFLIYCTVPAKQVGRVRALATTVLQEICSAAVAAAATTAAAAAVTEEAVVVAA